MKRDVREISPREQKLIHLLVTELCRHANFPNENEEEELYQYAWEVLLSNRALIQRLRKTAEQKGWEQVAESPVRSIRLQRAGQHVGCSFSVRVCCRARDIFVMKPQPDC